MIPLLVKVVNFEKGKPLRIDLILRGCLSGESRCCFRLARSIVEGEHDGPVDDSSQRAINC